MWRHFTAKLFLICNTRISMLTSIDSIKNYGHMILKNNLSKYFPFTGFSSQVLLRLNDAGVFHLRMYTGSS